ncbi:hypothetical protein MHU86_14972 [Fragilaria crotonensis]|nr:hypothetical protein MHU86_14972 [Fragilaria crotonensis]
MPFRHATPAAQEAAALGWLLTTPSRPLPPTVREIALAAELTPRAPPQPTDVRPGSRSMLGNVPDARQWSCTARPGRPSGASPHYRIPCVHW